MTENPEGVELGWASQEGRELGPRRGKHSHWPGLPHKVAETKEEAGRRGAVEGGDEREDGWEVGKKLSPESRGSATITESQGSISLTTGDVGPSRGRKPGSALGCAPGLLCDLG